MLAALVPPAVITVTATPLILPVPRLGTVAVSDVALATVTLLLAVEPKFTVVLPETKFVPVIVTLEPYVPEEGEILLMVGSCEAV